MQGPGQLVFPYKNAVVTGSLSDLKNRSEKVTG
ncbi:hypothetical protein SAMN05720354_10269 [Nitrosospira sp. Nsp1]|nr:hypothetical protein SAMN05720354_10269 [Nitrosospira sp. Nsp1]